MSMSRKHYRAFAEVLKNHEASKELCKDIADVFKEDNGMFCYQTFYNACGLNDKE